MAVTTTALATIDPSAFHIMNVEADELQEVLHDNLGGGQLSKFQLKRITMPGSGGVIWSLPSSQGDIDTREFTGIIVHKTDGRVYYKNPYGSATEGETNGPDCASEDGLQGIGVRFPEDAKNSNTVHECDDCPLSQWQGRQAPPCNQQASLFIVRENDLLPILFIAPRTSVKIVKDYALSLAYDSVPFWAVVTKFSLTKIPAQAGRPAYAQLALSKVADVPQEQRARLRDYRVAIKGMILNTRRPASNLPMSDIPEEPQDMTDEVL